MTSGASGDFEVTISTGAPSGSGCARSRTSPLTRTARAARASPGPIAAAASAPVAPSGSSSGVPSGRVTCTAGRLGEPRAGDAREQVELVGDGARDQTRLQHAVPAGAGQLDREPRVGDELGDPRAALVRRVGHEATAGALDEVLARPRAGSGDGRRSLPQGLRDRDAI